MPDTKPGLKDWVDRVGRDAVMRSLVKSILEHPEGHGWTLQGFGMLRTYITPELRLHVWDSRFRVKDVSVVHTHPWNFRSTVIAGVVRNMRYEEADGQGGLRYMRQQILCGPGGGFSEPDPVEVSLRVVRHWLIEPRETYVAGQVYNQLANEIHMSEPEDGTVTLVEREFLADVDHAYVYWRAGKEWVTAEPREATEDEVRQICWRALSRF